MSSQIAGEIARRYYEDACPSLQQQIDECLAPVRECLEGLSDGRMADGVPCWCSSVGGHSEACQRAREVWEQLQPKE